MEFYDANLALFSCEPRRLLATLGTKDECLMLLAAESADRAGKHTHSGVSEIFWTSQRATTYT